MTFTERLEAIKQYNDGMITFLELCRAMHMDADQYDALMLLQAAGADMAMSPNQMANRMDTMVEKERAGVQRFARAVVTNG